MNRANRPKPSRISGSSYASRLLNRAGDGSTLTLDFTTGQLDPRLIFTRSTTATYINSSGYVASAAINAPRFDYDPTTLAPRGLLIEGSATNLTKYSEDLSQVSGVNQWYGANMNTPTVPGGAPNSPYGTTSASWKLVATAGTALHVWRYSATFTAADYTFSFWAKAAEYDRIVLSDPGTGLGACTFVLTGDGTASAITGTATPKDPKIVKYGNGWYRCSVTMTMTAATYGIGIAGYPAGTTPSAFGASYNADGTSGVYATMFQTELGSGASSYIPTGASTASRSADLCYMTGTNFSSWFNASTGTIISKVTYSTLTGSNGGIELSVGTGSSPTNRIGIRKDYVDYYSGGGAAQAEMYPTVTSGAVQIGTAYAANDFAMCSNGGTMRTKSSGAVPIGLDTLKLYSDAGSSSGLFLNGWMRSFKYFPTRLPNAQLQSLTT